MKFIHAITRWALVAALVGWSATSMAQESGSETLSGGREPVQVAQLPVKELPMESGLISLDFKEADIQTVLQALARKAKMNVVTGKDIVGVVSIHLENVTWEQALDTIVKTYGFGYEKEENIILVSTLEELKARREAMRSLVEIEPVMTKVIQLKFLDAADVKSFLEPQLTSQGKISVLEMTGQKGWSFGSASSAGSSTSSAEIKREEREKARSKAVVVTDTPTTIDRLEKILSRVDVMPRQILIETRVMEVNRNLLRDLGLELGTGVGSTNTSSTEGFNSATSARTFALGSYNKTLGGADRSKLGGSLLNQFVAPSTFVPATTGLSAANTGLNLLFRQLRGTQYELLLRALEEDVRTNTLSAPNVLTLSGQEARILVGTKYPILQTQVSGTTTTTTTTTLQYYQDIGIELFVVPQVSGENYVDMIIHPVISSRTGTVGSNAYPILDVREAETQVILEQGETIVIGGLLKDVKSKSRIGIPFLGKLPLIGPVFSRTTNDTEKIDLLIFITARIVEPGSLSQEEVRRLQEQYQEFVHEKLAKPASALAARSSKPAEEKTTQENRGILYRKP